MIFSLRASAGRTLVLLLVALLALMGLSQSEYDAETRQLISEMKRNEAAIQRGIELYGEDGLEPSLDDLYDYQIFGLRTLQDSDVKHRDKWTKKLIGTLRDANRPPRAKYTDQLKELHDELAERAPGTELTAKVELCLLELDYGKQLENPQANFQIVQDWWKQSLKALVREYPRGESSAEANLAIAVAEEFASNEKAALERYVMCVNSGVDNARTNKADGAIKRLSSVGKELVFSGPSAFDPTQVESTEHYRGKFVLIHFWATWCEPCIAEMKQLRRLQKFHRKDFAVIGVNLDSNVNKIKKYHETNPPSWAHIHSKGGFDSASATELGIATLPTHLLLDRDGKLVGQNIGMAQLEKTLLDAAAAAAAR